MRGEGRGGERRGEGREERREEERRGEEWRRGEEMRGGEGRGGEGKGGEGGGEGRGEERRGEERRGEEIREEKRREDKRRHVPMNPFLASSMVNLLVISSSSLSEYFLGSIFTPAFAPPNGTSTHAHLYVMRDASAITSSTLTSSLKRIPATRLYSSIVGDTGTANTNQIIQVTEN